MPCTMCRKGRRHFQGTSSLSCSPCMVRESAILFELYDYPGGTIEGGALAKKCMSYIAPLLTRMKRVINLQNIATDLNRSTMTLREVQHTQQPSRFHC